MAPTGPAEAFWWSPGKPCRGVLQLPVHKFGVLRYPYFSTPTGAPGPGPYTVSSAVGPGPKQRTGTRGLGRTVILTPHPSRLPQTARVERGIVGRGMRDVGGVRGDEPRRHVSRRGFFI